MKKIFFNSLIILFLAPVFSAFGQNKVYISKSVLKTAEWANFSYKEVLNKAIAGDVPSIVNFFKFNNAVDGVEAIDHNITCLELIPLASDDKVALALVNTNPRLKKVVLDRIILAQGKTQKADLKKPMESWAPKTWAVINNKPLPAPTYTDEELAGKLKSTDQMEGERNARNPSPAGLSPATPDDSRMPSAKPDDAQRQGGGKKQ